MEKSDEAEPAVSWNAYAKQPFFAGEDFILHTQTCGSALIKLLSPWIINKAYALIKGHAAF